MLCQYTLVNAYDEIVKTHVRQLMEKEPDMCRCEKCFLDVCAMVFNQGYATFVTTYRGQVLTETNWLKHANQTDLTVAIISAINKVKASPQHTQ